MAFIALRAQHLGHSNTHGLAAQRTVVFFHCWHPNGLQTHQNPSKILQCLSPKPLFPTSICTATRRACLSQLSLYIRSTGIEISLVYQTFARGCSATHAQHRVRCIANMHPRVQHSSVCALIGAQSNVPLRTRISLQRPRTCQTTLHLFQQPRT